MVSTGKSEYCWMERIKWTCHIASTLKISSRTIVFICTLLSIPMHVLPWNADSVGIENHALWYLSLPMVYCITSSRSLWYFDTVLMCSCFKLPVCVHFLNPFLGYWSTKQRWPLDLFVRSISAHDIRKLWVDSPALATVPYSTSGYPLPRPIRLNNFSSTFNLIGVIWHGLSGPGLILLDQSLDGPDQGWSCLASEWSIDV